MMRTEVIEHENDDGVERKKKRRKRTRRRGRYKRLRRSLV